MNPVFRVRAEDVETSKNLKKINRKITGSVIRGGSLCEEQRLTLAAEQTNTTNNWRKHERLHTAEKQPTWVKSVVSSPTKPVNTSSIIPSGPVKE